MHSLRLLRFPPWILAHFPGPSDDSGGRGSDFYRGFAELKSKWSCNGWKFKFRVQSEVEGGKKIKVRLPSVLLKQDSSLEDVCGKRKRLTSSGLCVCVGGGGGGDAHLFVGGQLPAAALLFCHPAVLLFSALNRM